MRRPAELVLKKLAVRLSGATVLRDVDLRVPPGSMTSIVGPSGAGKTTLLRAIAGLVPLAEGHLELGGRSLDGVPVHRRRVAVVFQEPRLFPNLDVAENVAFPLRVAGRKRRPRREEAARLLDEVGLAGFADRRVGGLSGGERQRVALARALAARPDLLLLDEPLSSVDAHRREDLRRLISAVQREHATTALYVTHDRTEAAEMGDHIALVIEGRVVVHAPPREVFERPRSATVARFFGAANLVTGHVRDGRLQLPGGWLPADGSDGPATVAIRPERIAVVPGGEATVRGRVSDVTYQGSHLRVLVDVGVPLEVHAPTSPQLAPGDAVGLAVRGSAVWRLPDADHDVTVVP
ncbi:MAG: ABC transporter ATP-binding protein [Actinobacteria bacterium]|nr:ABC transporter ATP-binding protein [Actinomycetota bacterium]